MRLTVRTVCTDRSSNASWYTTTERDWWREGESRPCWILEGGDWWRRGVTSCCHAQIWELSCQSEKPETDVKFQKCLFFKEKLPQDLRLQSGTWARTECHGGRPIFFLEKTQTNVTDVLLGLPAGRHGPSPTRAVLRRISYSFHRGCGIAGRIERLEQWWVDLDVSGHEADWASLACL